MAASGFESVGEASSDCAACALGDCAVAWGSRAAWRCELERGDVGEVAPRNVFFFPDTRRRTLSDLSPAAVTSSY